MLTVFNGGKEMGSKIKFSKFYIIFDVAPSDAKAFNVQTMYLKFCAAIEKGIMATKAGLAAFKRAQDGSYFNAYDNINECFKLIEDAIN
jgi:hypothetical protein